MWFPSAFNFLGFRNFVQRERRKQHEIPSRGVYGLVSDDSTPSAKERKLPEVVPMVSLLLAGIALMLAHHFFYAYLDSKIIDPAASYLPHMLRDQTTPYIIGTVIAHGARLMLSMVVNATFAQLFWETLRSRNRPTQEIDALVQCGRNPFHPSAMRSLITAPLLLLVSLVAAGMGVVVILSPGSLTVSSSFQRSDACIVPTAPNLTEVTLDLNAPTVFIPQKIHATGTYFPPFRADVCASGTSSCSYNISFLGPAFKCLDVSDQTDFASSLNSSDGLADSSAPFAIWNTSWSPQYPVILVSTWDLEKNVMQANNCTAYQATYQAGVTLNPNSTSAEIWDVALESTGYSGNETIFWGNLMDSYIDLALQYLAGPVFAGPNGFLLEPLVGLNSLSNSRIFVTTPSGNHTWSDNMTNVLTSYMQNVSISLLSGIIGINESFTGASQNLLYVNSSCVSIWDAYVYSPTRLLTTYGVAFILALCIAIPGISLILRNGVEEKIVISHIIQSALNPQSLRTSFHTSKDTIEMTRAHTSPRILEHPVNISSTQRRLSLKPNLRRENDESNLSGQSLSTSSSKIISIRNCFQTRRQASKNQMIILTSGGILCMTMHHLYYSFLNDISPGSSNSRTRWITEQRVVSDIGIAIAYAGQICPAAAIAISSQQLFWHILRRRAHTVSQIDSLMRMQQNPFSTSLFRCTQASLALIVAAFISTSLPLISTFAPNSIKLSFDHLKSTECTITTPRNLASLQTTNISDYSVPINSVFISGSYSPPANPCNGDLGLQCNYNVEFQGPGLYCSDVTTSKNYTAFEDANLLGRGPKPPEALNVWLSSVEGDENNRTMRLSVQTWDQEASVFQALDCAGVIRSYTLVVTHGSSSTIEVTRSDVLSPILVNPGSNLSSTDFTMTASNVSFSQQYLLYTMKMVQGAYAIGAGYSALNFEGLFHFPNILSSATDELTVIWNKNMDQILEQFAQNTTLSLLSGQIFLLNSIDGQELLEDFRTTCDYMITAYEYSPSRLFATYGIAIFLTTLCTIGGMYAITRNGVDETMDYSRFLRAVLSEKMLEGRDRIQMDSEIKAEDNDAGSFAPFLNPNI